MGILEQVGRAFPPFSAPFTRGYKKTPELQARGNKDMIEGKDFRRREEGRIFTCNLDTTSIMLIGLFA